MRLFTTETSFALDRPSNGSIPTNEIVITENGSDPPKQASNKNVATEWYLILVNRWNPILDDYKVELMEMTNGQSIDRRIYPALQEMFDAARRDGVYPVVSSGYRTSEEQQRLLNNKIAAFRDEGYSPEESVFKAKSWVAAPGASEHQLGLAVDIGGDGINSIDYSVYEWMNQNSYKYGFISRYPAGKTEITGVNNELWHYRYVGTDVATEMYYQGLCLEEYLR